MVKAQEIGEPQVERETRNLEEVSSDLCNGESGMHREGLPGEREQHKQRHREKGRRYLGQGKQPSRDLLPALCGS